jgi:hypothetical protein
MASSEAGATCDVDGTTYPSGPLATNACQVCDPTMSTSSFTNVTDGTACGDGNVCAAGQCGIPCMIGSAYYNAGVTNPTNGCEVCDPTTSTTAWSNAADGATCSAGVCCAGACANEQTDNNNCGGCGLVCGNACTSGECIVTLAKSQPFPSNLAVDGTNVYWTDFGASGSVNMVPLAGGTTTMLASAQGGPAGIAVHGGTVYWADAISGNVMSIGVDGSALSTIALGQAKPYAVAVDAANVYWTNAGTGAAAIMKSALGTVGSPTVLATGLTAPVALAVDATQAYWTDPSGTVDVGKVLLTGGPVQAVATGQTAPGGIGVSGGLVFWTVTGGVAEGSTGSTGSLAFATGQAGPQALAVDASNVYWADYSSGALVKQALSGGAPTTLATGQTSPDGIVVDATSVYWGTYASSGTIMKLTPK